MNNRWRHKIKLRRKYKKIKKPKVRIMGWGDFLDMKDRPSIQELLDAFDEYMKSKEGNIDDSK